MHVNQQPVSGSRASTVWGVTRNACTPAIVVSLTLTCGLSRIPGSIRRVAFAPAATVARHWSGLSGSTFQPGRNGAAISAWIGVLTLEATGIVFAGTSRGVRRFVRQAAYAVWLPRRRVAVRIR